MESPPTVRAADGVGLVEDTHPVVAVTDSGDHDGFTHLEDPLVHGQTVGLGDIVLSLIADLGRVVAVHIQRGVGREGGAPRAGELADLVDEDLLDVLSLLQRDVDLGAVLGLDLIVQGQGSGVEDYGRLHGIVQVEDVGTLHAVVGGLYHVALEVIAVGLHHEAHARVADVTQEQSGVAFCVQTGDDGGVVEVAHVGGGLVGVLGGVKDLHLQVAEGEVHARMGEDDLGAL